MSAPLMWFIVAACSNAPPAPEALDPPDAVDLPSWVPDDLALSEVHIESLQAIRLRVGLAAKDDNARCNALEEIGFGRQLLGSHFRAHPELSAERLSEPIPGLIFSRGADPEVDYLELARAFGPSGATTAIVSAAAFLGTPPIWRHPEHRCFDANAARPWMRRLGPSFAHAPACVRDYFRDEITADLTEMAVETCYCGDNKTTPAALEKLAVVLSNTKDPDGNEAARALRESLASDKARFDCRQ